MEDGAIANLIKRNDKAFKNVTQVRLVDADGSQVGVVSLEEAIAKAESRAMDLVMVAETATPPVCKILDFGKLQYEQKRKKRDQKKHQHAQKLKEIKFRVNIDPHDYGIKIQHATEFLEKGYKVKLSLQFRGRESAHQSIGFEVVDKAIQSLKELGVADGRPSIAGRTITVCVTPTGHT